MVVEPCREVENAIGLDLETGKRVLPKYLEEVTVKRSSIVAQTARTSAATTPLGP